MLQTKMAGLEFKNPLMAGCAGITETAELIEKWLKAGAGGILAKSITTDESLRTYIKPTFYPLNKYGLKGAMTESELLHKTPPDIWAEKEAPKIKKVCKEYGAVWIQSIVGQGDDLKDWAGLAKLVEDAGADGIELDLCCPLAPGESQRYSNIELGEDPVITAALTAAVKRAVKIPVGVKLSPTVRRLDRVAAAAWSAGADFCTCVNAPPGFCIDIEREEIRGANTFVGYLPGPSLKWWGLWKVTQVKMATDIEVSGCGGIWTAGDAIEYILAGCPTIQIVSSVYFKGPKVFTEIIEGIKDFMGRKGYKNIEDFRGKILGQLKQYSEVPKEKQIQLPSPILPKFDLEKCSFCGQCATSCIHDAIKVNKAENQVELLEEKCHGCGFCCGLCPQNAIEMYHKPSGKMVWDGVGTLNADWIKW